MLIPFFAERPRGGGGEREREALEEREREREICLLPGLETLPHPSFPSLSSLLGFGM